MSARPTPDLPLFVDNPPLFVGALSEEGYPTLSTPSTDITLRDVFAAAITAGWLAHPDVDTDSDSGWRDRFAADVYDLADALLRRRAVPGLRPDSTERGR